MNTSFKNLYGVLLILVALLASCTSASFDDCSQGKCDNPFGDEAPISLVKGPHEIAVGEYKLPAALDPLILNDRLVEMWASVHRPQDLGAESHPLLVFIHGNHQTCGSGSNPRIDDSSEYTGRGSCPEGKVVVPSHRGYDYLADHLASWGYIVVSINANRGLTAARGTEGDFGLNLAKGRLVLQHLALLGQWNSGEQVTPDSLGISLQDAIDFSSIGLMGHSRGGETMRAVYTQLGDSPDWQARVPEPTKIEGIFEIAPVDGQTSKTLNALDTAWGVLLPLCDGDVVDMKGLMPFERMRDENERNPALKTAFAVWGANHNFFNTEWQVSEVESCTGVGHTKIFDQGDGQNQRTIGLATVTNFFRSTVGVNKDPSFAQLFDPYYNIPEPLASITNYQRVFIGGATETQRRSLVTLDELTRFSVSSTSAINADVSVVPRYDERPKALELQWSLGSRRRAQTLTLSFDHPKNLSDDGMLQFRISDAGGVAPELPPTFSIQLKDASGIESAAIKLSDYHTILPPVGVNNRTHFVLDTVRIPLAGFSGIDMSNVTELVLVFEESDQGLVYLSDFSVAPELRKANAPPEISLPDLPDNPTESVVPPAPRVEGNRVGSSVESDDNKTKVTFVSNSAFITNSGLPRLLVGDRQFLDAEYGSADGGETEISFYIPTLELREIAHDCSAFGDVEIIYDDNESYRWVFGSACDQAW